MDARSEAKKDDKGMSLRTLLSISGVAKYTALAMVVRHLALTCAPADRLSTEAATLPNAELVQLTCP